MQFSKSTQGFYPASLAYANLPADLIGITEDEYARAMQLLPGESLDVRNGALVIVPPPVPTSAEVLAAAAAAMTAAVQVHMDTQARAHGYDSLLSAISYADEPAVVTYQTQGRAFRAWRSQVWARCHALLAEIQAGTLAVPTTAELLGLLPEVAL